MKYNVCLMCLIMFFICACNKSKKKEREKLELNREMKSFESSMSSSFLKVQSLKSNNDLKIGDVYVRYINDSIFTDLFVINGIDTLYKIEKCNFYNNRGLDIDVYCDGFFGYKLVLHRNDYLVLSYYRNNGLNVSDDITINWNYSKNIIEVLKLP